MLGALNQGALADSFKRFPGIAWIFLKVMPGAIQRIIEDTKKNENYAIELIKKYVFQHLRAGKHLSREYQADSA